MTGESKDTTPAGGRGPARRPPELADQMRRVAILRRRKTPIILQTEAAECGIACLAMIAGRYG
jgi:Peptidase C39 family